MPPISSRLVPKDNVRLAEPTPLPAGPAPPIISVPINPVLRCPLPNIIPTSPDSLRQIGLAGQIPQYRFPALKPLS